MHAAIHADTGIFILHVINVQYLLTVLIDVCYIELIKLIRCLDVAYKVYVLSI